MTKPPQHVRIAKKADLAELSNIRRSVVGFLRQHNAADDLVDDLSLVVSELASNVIEHTDSDTILVVVERTASDWVIDVADAESIPGLDDLSAPDPSMITGRGLFVVQSLVDSMKIVDEGGSFVVRCRRSV